VTLPHLLPPIRFVGCSSSRVVSETEVGKIERSRPVSSIAFTRASCPARTNFGLLFRNSSSTQTTVCPSVELAHWCATPFWLGLI
jgi:hypothetical protein